MAKNKNTMKGKVPDPTPSSSPLDSRGKALVGAGGALVIAGFVLLSFANARATNLPGLLSPFFLIAGYAAIGVGLFLPPAPPAA